MLEPGDPGVLKSINLADCNLDCTSGGVPFHIVCSAGLLDRLQELRVRVYPRFHRRKSCRLVVVALLRRFRRIDGDRLSQLHALRSLAQNGMADPGKSWGDAAAWAGRVGGVNHSPTMGSIAWWGTEVGRFGHVGRVWNHLVPAPSTLGDLNSDGYVG